MSDVPIKPIDYSGGVNVVDIGDLRVARGKSERRRSQCRHLNLVYDDSERRVFCEDCESEIEAFDAFKGLVEHIDGTVKRLQYREDILKNAESTAVRSIAVKNLDKVWRTRNRVPLCPHCNEALLPEDFKNGIASTGAELVRKRRGLKGKEGL
jgi:hypothetical protein